MFLEISLKCVTTVRDPLSFHIQRLTSCTGILKIALDFPFQGRLLWNIVFWKIIDLLTLNILFSSSLEYIIHDRLIFAT